MAPIHRQRGRRRIVIVRDQEDRAWSQLRAGPVEELRHHAAAIHGHGAEIQLEAAAQGTDALIGHRVGQNDVLGTRHAAQNAGEPMLRPIGEDNPRRIDLADRG